jgi:tetratricopeptide (TPR) repeat protein
MKESTIEIKKDNIEKLNEQAKKYYEEKKYDEAIECLESIDSKFFPNELLPNLAKCYYYKKNAQKSLDLVENYDPKTHDVWMDIAIYHNALGHFDKALEIYESLDESDPRIKFNKGWHYLRKGNFKKGFENIAFGKDCGVWGSEHILIKNNKINPDKRWDGSRVDHLLLILEGGIGDEIIFIRWANYLKTKCNKLTITCDRQLLRLLANSGYDIFPNDLIENINYNAYVPAMSLPNFIEVDGPKDKVSFPYIQSISEPYITKQMDMLANGRKKIGVRWKGNPEFEHDQFRTIPKEFFYNLEKYGQVFSIQIDEDDTNFPSCSHLINDWQDTYSVFTGLDLLITSCTSTAHLAGAMNIPTIVLPPLVPYFIWSCDDIKWYESVKVIRQNDYNDWTNTIKDLYEFLDTQFQ